MKRRFVLLALLVPALAHAQRAEPDALGAVRELLPAPGIGRNVVTNLHAEGAELWVGPLLNVTRDGGATWQVANIDSVRFGRLGLRSIDVEGDVVWAGLSMAVPDDAGTLRAAAGGFAFSTDGGQTFTLRRPPLDEARDTTETYGVSTILAAPITSIVETPPADIDYDPATGRVWTAGWFSGLRYSDDDGQTWQRVVLPPDDLDELTPGTIYGFVLAPKFNPASPAGNYNHFGYSVLVDADGVVWAGTWRGVNISRDGGVSWRRYSYTGGPGGLTGPLVYAVEEQPRPGRNAVWIASWADGNLEPGSRFGVTVSRDGGQTFEQVLAGERVYDFAFAGSVVYAAGASGLLISDDDGATWRVVRDFFDPERPTETVRPDVTVYAVATTSDGALWVGTDDGLFKSTDGGVTFRRFRAETSPRPAQPSARAPSVGAYAYPNPFSPEVDRFVRICYSDPQDERRCADLAADVQIRVFDFGMNLVRTLDEPLWDGRDDHGYRVANGTYFYAIEAGGETLRGKILVLE